jgi:hypothetical protein
MAKYCKSATKTTANIKNTIWSALSFKLNFLIF